MSGVTMFTRPRLSVRGKSTVPYASWTSLANSCVSSLDYLFQLAVEMKKLGLPWISEVAQIAPQRT